MTYEELNQDLSDLQRAETTVEFMNLFRQMLNEARFFSHDERSLRGYLIEDIEKFVAPMRERRKELEKDIPKVLKILKEGRDKAKIIASKKMEEVREKIGVKIDCF